MEAAALILNNSLPDAGVLERAKKGDVEAFELLVREHDRKVYRVALRVLGDREAASDVLQEVLLRLHRSIRGISDAQLLGAWLYRVTINICLDMMRSRRPVEPLKWDRVSEEPDPEAQSEAEQRHRLLQAALLRLSEKQRAAVVLRDVEGLSTAEVAAAMNTSEATVRAHIHQARTKLREWLKEVR